FEKAIAGSNLYNDILNSAEAKKLDANGIFEEIAIRDVQDACDIFKPVYAETKRRDGYVSLEVSPFLGFDTNASLAEARRLWKAVDRPNVMIKIPGTPQAPSFRERSVGIEAKKRGNSAPVEGRGSPERHDQDPRHAPGTSRYTPGSRRRHQHQYHVAFRAVGIRTGCGSVSFCSRGPRRKGARCQPHRECRQLFRQSH